MADSPRISVIVGAYRRERFLPAAVGSVLGQTIPRDEVELLVTKGFASAPVDQFLVDRRVKVLRDDDPHIGPWLWRAIRATSAPLVAFLDDDDLYEPSRLARVVEVFREQPDVGYYRNRVRVVDVDGHPLPPRYWGRHEVDAELDATGPVHIAPREKVSRLPTLKRTYPLFNSSSIVIRRELLDGEMAERFRETQNPDPFLLLAAVVSPFGLFLDDRRLTQYRRHPGNVTSTVWALRHGFQDSVRLAEIAQRLAPREYADWLRRRSVRIEKRLCTESIVAAVAGRAPRREVATLASGYLRFLQRHPEERKVDAPTWAAPAYGVSYLMVPPVAHRMLGAMGRLRSYRVPPTLHSA